MRASTSTGHALPPLSGARDTSRRWKTWPSSPLTPTHEWEQAEGLPQLVTMQSSGHASELQARVCLVAWHLPPLAAAVSTAAERDCLPPPHLRLHTDHGENGESWQSVGHTCALHLRSWRSSGHFLPPKAGSLMCARVRHMEPPPQTLSQVLHGDQLVTLQSVAQAKVLQLCSWRICSFGHGLPPKVAWMTVRWRIVTPLPQLLEHLPQAPKPLSLQSVGQACTLHGRFCERAPHCLPPLRASVSTLRKRCSAPPPQVLSHFCHGPQEPMRQSTGQLLVAQARGCVSAPQALPPKADVTSMER